MIGSVLACNKDSGPSFLNAGIGLRDESRHHQKVVASTMNDNQPPLFFHLLLILTPLPTSISFASLPLDALASSMTASQ
jgi:hypothetical protein